MVHPNPVADRPDQFAAPGPKANPEGRDPTDIEDYGRLRCTSIRTASAPRKPGTVKARRLSTTCTRSATNDGTAHACADSYDTRLLLLQLLLSTADEGLLSAATTGATHVRLLLSVLTLASSLPMLC